MIAFEVYRNGEKLCLAGVGEFGVLTADITCVLRSLEDLREWPEEFEEGPPEPVTLELSVGGLTPAKEHLYWVNKSPLHVGDEVRMVVVEAGAVDPPTKRHREETPDPEMRKQFVRLMAAEYGWQLQE
jgi:hypothetical protein